MDTDIKHDPIPVVITNQAEKTREYAPELAAWSSYSVPTTLIGANALQILPQDTRRKKAIIYCSDPAVTTAFIILGRREAVMNGQGFTLFAGGNVTVESQSAVYLVGDGVTTPTVSVLDQRYIK